MTVTAIRFAWVRAVPASVVALGMRAAAMAAWAVAGIVVARALPVSDRGAYALTILVASVLLALLTGVAAAAGQAVLRRGLAPGVAVAAAGWAGLLAMGSWLGLGLALAGSQAGLLSAACVVAAMSAPAVGLRSAIGAVALARERAWLFNLATHGPAFATVALLVALLAATGRLSVAGAVAAWLIAQYGALVAVAVLAPDWLVEAVHSGRRGVAALGALRGFALPAGAIAVVAVLNSRVDLLIVGTVAGRTAAGLYASANSILDVLGAAGIAISVSLYGRIGGSSAGQAAALTAVGARQAFVAVAVPASLFAFVAPQALVFLFGSAYLPAAAAVRVMCLAAVLLAPQTVLATYFVVQRGRPAIALALAGLSVTIEAGLALLLVPAIGIVGGAWASVAAYGLTLAVLLLLFRRTVQGPSR